MSARPLARSIVLAALAAIVVALVPAPSATAGSNVLVNPGFEWSVAEGSITSASPLHGTLVQPILPTGWAVEGSAGLFDHADPRADVTGLGGRSSHSGLRFVAISDPASGNPDVCAQPPVGCHDNPAEIVKAAADDVYSINPVWRNAQPVAVTAGLSYTLRTYTILDFQTIGTGSFVQIRWLNALGAPVGMSARAARIQSSFDPVSTPWQLLSLTATAPTGATQAVALLGHTGDVWIGQVRFDDACFVRSTLTC